MHDVSPPAALPDRGFSTPLLTALLLWLPLLLFTLIRPFPASDVFTTPVLRHSFALVAAVWAGVVLLFAAYGGLLAPRLERWVGLAPGTGSPLTIAVVIASSLLFFTGRWWAVLPDTRSGPGTVVLLLLLWLAAPLVPALGVRLLPARRRPGGGKLAAALLLAAWVVAVASYQELSAADVRLWLLLTVLLPLLPPLLPAVAGGERWAQKRPGLLLLFAVGAGALFVAGAAATASEAAPRPGRPASPEARPNVVLMVIDTLRADHTSLGGYPRPTTPRLQALAGEGATAFLAAQSPATSTIPSVKAMLTGQAPSRWGLDQAGEAPPEGVWSLPQAFFAAGYRTAGFTSNALISGGGFETGFDGFSFFSGQRFFRSTFLLDDLLTARNGWRSLRLADRLRIHKVSGKTLVGRVRRWMEAWSTMPGEAPPFFLYVHIIDPHWPYYDHGGELLSPELRRLEPKLSHVDLLQRRGDGPAKAALRDSRELQEMLGRYDEEIRFADTHLGSLVDDLERFGFAESTLLMVVGDHGEEFFEHDGFSHGHDVFGEQSHVPFVIRWPEAAAFRAFPETVAAPVSPMDLLPTLTELLALPPPPAAIEGRSLLPLLEGEAPPRPVLSEAHPLGGCRFGYWEGDLKVRLETNYRVSPSETEGVSLFDLARDPKETAPLRVWGPEEEAVVARARQAAQQRWLHWPDRLRLTREAPSDSEPVPSDEERDRALEELRALGYVD